VTIALASLGARVTSVDLSIERLKIAKKRLEYYVDKSIVDSAHIEFIHRNVLEYCGATFDILYAKEFVSHVYSIRSFLQFRSNQLKPGGVLIISDGNPLNPVVSMKARRAHKYGLFKNRQESNLRC